MQDMIQTVKCSAWSASVSEGFNVYEYDPFGNIVKCTGPLKDENPFRFSTKYQDNETGLLYYGYRYYNADMGRWISRDPLGEPGHEIGFDQTRSLWVAMRHAAVPSDDGEFLSERNKNKQIMTNPYEFCSNNPIGRIDHLGEFGKNPCCHCPAPQNPALIAADILKSMAAIVCSNTAQWWRAPRSYPCKGKFKFCKNLKCKVVASVYCRITPEGVFWKEVDLKSIKQYRTCRENPGPLIRDDPPRK